MNDSFDLKDISRGLGSNYAMPIIGNDNGAIKNTDKPIASSKLTRLELGEAHMWCIDCNCKLYSFDGNEDLTQKCPHTEKCERDRIKLKNNK